MFEKKDGYIQLPPLPEELSLYEAILTCTVVSKLPMYNQAVFAKLVACVKIG